MPFKPIHDIRELNENLGERTMAGFGGVAEYGITVRWDKNFLKIIRLLLERRHSFAMFGGVRFGGTITLDQAFDLGFDHVALALGAGKPTILDLPNGLAPGVRMASDFLMALQLTGAAKTDSIANLQLRLPAVVIGGGLTAIDTATEALAYYPLQVEKFLRRYEVLAAEQGEESVRRRWSAAELPVVDEFIAHARAIREERVLARRELRAPRLRELMDGWGGVTIAYRRRLIDAPSYTLNHEEVAKALEEGIRFAEGLTPTAIDVDETGRCKAIQLVARRGVGDLPGAHRAGGGRHAAEHRAGPRACGAVRPRRPVFQGGRRAAASRRSRNWSAKPKAPLCAASAAARRPRRQLLRRSASLLRRQCGEGHGQRQARLAGGGQGAGGPSGCRRRSGVGAHSSPA